MPDKLQSRKKIFFDFCGGNTLTFRSVSMIPSAIDTVTSRKFIDLFDQSAKHFKLGTFY